MWREACGSWVWPVGAAAGRGGERAGEGRGLGEKAAAREVRGMGVGRRSTVNTLVEELIVRRTLYSLHQRYIKVCRLF
jgi:hypothetical protein